MRFTRIASKLGDIQNVRLTQTRYSNPKSVVNNKRVLPPNPQHWGDKTLSHLQLGSQCGAEVRSVVAPGGVGGYPYFITQIGLLYKRSQNILAVGVAILLCLYAHKIRSKATM